MKHQNFTYSDDPILRIPDVEYEVGLSKSTIYSLVNRNEFPAPIKISSRASGWLLSELKEWKQQRIAESRPEKCGE